MAIRKQPEASLKVRYKLVMKITTFIVLIGMIAMFKAFPRFQAERTQIEQPDIATEILDIPPETMQQFEEPVKPSRPSIPIESEDESISDELTIEETTFDEFEVWEAPPPPPSADNGPRVRFIPYDEAPEPIGGFKAIQANVIYPDIAREAGIEGTVVIQAFVNEKGKVTECVVLKGIPKTGLNEAAINAIKKTAFKPAKQRDRDVGVWISIPVIFKLRSG